MPTVTAKQRDGKVRPKVIRRKGDIPAVLYGHKIKNLHLTLDGKTFPRLYREVGESTVLNLRVEGEPEERSVLVYDVSRDPVRDAIVHVDFYEVRKDEKIKMHIPLEFKGESDAVKSLGGVLVKNTYKVEIEALPKDLPREITVDISKLATFEEMITLGSLVVPQGVKLFGDPKEIIAKVLPPRTEEELAALKEEVVMNVEEVKVETEEKKKEREAAKAEEGAEKKEEPAK